MKDERVIEMGEEGERGEGEMDKGEVEVGEERDR